MPKSVCRMVSADLSAVASAWLPTVVSWITTGCVSDSRTSTRLRRKFIDNEKDYGWDSDSDNFWHQLCRAEPTIRKIIGRPRCDARRRLRSQRQRRGRDGAQSRAPCTLGILDDMDEWAVRLQPEAPSLPADQFHPWVWDAAQTFWKSKHYRAAVDAAATAINEHTQTKVGRRDISDNDLMNQAFTERPKAGQVYLRLPGDATNDQTLRSRNNALRPFAESCFAGIRTRQPTNMVTTGVSRRLWNISPPSAFSRGGSMNATSCTAPDLSRYKAQSKTP